MWSVLNNDKTPAQVCQVKHSSFLESQNRGGSHWKESQKPCDPVVSWGHLAVLYSHSAIRCWTSDFVPQFPPLCDGAGDGHGMVLSQGGCELACAGHCPGPSEPAPAVAQVNKQTWRGLNLPEVT